MATQSLQWFRFFVSDFDADTHWLSAAEAGAYLRLLMLAWRTPECSIPIEASWIKKRLRITSEAEFASYETVLAEFWQIKDGRFHNKRLTEEYKASVARYKAVKKGGEANAKRIAAKNGKKSSTKTNPLKTNKTKSSSSSPSAIAEGELRASGSGSGSSSSSGSIQNRGEGSGEGGAARPAKTGPSMDQMFDQWWAVYPKRTDKADARKVFAKTVEQDGFEAIMTGARKYADHHKQAATPRKYLKGPAAWLRAGKHHDEYQEESNLDQLLDAAIFDRPRFSGAMDQQPFAEAERGGSEGRAEGDVIEGEWTDLG
jgi:uncharacterized protein YdaU (DUF1376 family)